MIRLLPTQRTAPRATPMAPPVASCSVDEAFSFCESIVRGHHENFPVASRFVPAELRRYVWSVYAFARMADDFADEPRFEGLRESRLDEWEERLERAYHGEADHPIFIALRETIERRDIPISPLRDLLTSFRMDVDGARYATFDALRNYMQLSAAPVGQVLLYVFDYRDPALLRFSDELCAGLEFTHFLQDLRDDIARGRLYLPVEDLRHFGVSESSLKNSETTDALRDLLRFEVARTRALFDRGRPLADRVGRDFGFELNLIVQGGLAILDQIERAGFDVFARRPQLTSFDKLRMVARSAERRWASHWPRVR